MSFVFDIVSNAQSQLCGGISRTIQNHFIYMGEFENSRYLYCALSGKRLAKISNSPCMIRALNENTIEVRSLEFEEQNVDIYRIVREDISVQNVVYVVGTSVHSPDATHIRIGGMYT
jgi:hypothetical protein